MTQPEKKSRFVMPHPIVLIYALVILTVVLTWVVPAGEFQRVETLVDGSSRLVTVPGTFQRLAQRPAGPAALLLAPESCSAVTASGPPGGGIPRSDDEAVRLTRCRTCGTTQRSGRRPPAPASLA